MWILGFQSWQVCLNWSVHQFTNPICFTNLISIIVQTKDAILFIINSSRKHLLWGYMRRAMHSVLYLDYLMHLSSQSTRNISVLFPLYKWGKWDSKQASDLINKLAGKSEAADTENQSLFRSLFLILQSGVSSACWCNFAPCGRSQTSSLQCFDLQSPVHCSHLCAQNWLGDKSLGKACLLLESFSLDGYVSSPILLGRTKPCGHAYLQGILETEREARQPSAGPQFHHDGKGTEWFCMDSLWCN